MPTEHDAMKEAIKAHFSDQPEVAGVLNGLQLDLQGARATRQRMLDGILEYKQFYEQYHEKVARLQRLIGYLEELK